MVSLSYRCAQRVGYFLLRCFCGVTLAETALIRPDVTPDRPCAGRLRQASSRRCSFLPRPRLRREFRYHGGWLSNPTCHHRRGPGAGWHGPNFWGVAASVFGAPRRRQRYGCSLWTIPGRLSNVKKLSEIFQHSMEAKYLYFSMVEPMGSRDEELRPRRAPRTPRK